MRVDISLSATPTVADTQSGGEVIFHRVNAGRNFPKNHFGYWRSSLDSGGTLPFPVVWEIEGYDSEAFLAQLARVEEHAEWIGYRGFSPHRWLKKPNGSREYRHNGWTWPAGARTYLEAGVPPSRAFFSFIMGEDNPHLPY